MKERNDFLLLVVLMSMMGMSVAAHDIEVANSDFPIKLHIYYFILSKKIQNKKRK